jgi:hypothetical protein
MLAFAAWEKRTSRRAQGRAGENNTATTGPCIHRKSLARHLSHSAIKGRQRLCPYLAASYDLDFLLL